MRLYLTVTIYLLKHSGLNMMKSFILKKTKATAEKYIISMKMALVIKIM